MLRYYSGDYHNDLTDAIDALIDEGVIDSPPTLKAYAQVMGINPVRVYTVAKQPREGEIYDARVFNYESVGFFFQRRLDVDMGYGNMRDLTLKAIEADKVSIKSDRRRNKVRQDKVTLSTGSKIPMRREQFVMGEHVTLKGEEHTMEVVYITDSHVCFLVDGGPDLRVLSNWTINSNEVVRIILEVSEDVTLPVPEVEIDARLVEVE